MARSPQAVLQALPSCFTGKQAVQLMNEALEGVTGDFDMRARQYLSDAVNGPSSIGLEIPWFAKDPVYCQGSAPYEKVKALIAGVVTAPVYGPPTPQQVQSWSPPPPPPAPDRTWLWITGAAVVALSAGLVYLGRKKRLDAVIEATTPLRGSGALEERLQLFFGRRMSRGKGVVAPRAAMGAFTSAELARAVRSGMLRKGVSGYWLREEPDPGAMLVMRRQRREANYATG